MNKFVEILLGLVLLLVPIYAWIVDFARFGTAAMIVFKGAIVWMVLLAGLVLLLVGLSSLKD